VSNSKKVRVAIVGVGNCASSLVQGVQYYRNAQPDDFVPDLMHVNLCGYHISDIEFSAAIDIDQNKWGMTRGRGSFGPPIIPTNSLEFHISAPMWNRALTIIVSANNFRRSSLNRIHQPMIS